MFDEKFQNALRELIAFYHNRACPCAFPRFRKLMALDFSAIILEKEALIKLARLNCEVEEFTERTDRHEHWTCKTCGSTFIVSFEPLLVLPGRWEDRTVVNRNQQLCTDIGEEPESLVPLCLATLPKYLLKEKVRVVSKTAFIKYMRKLK